jgi:hypothetical protein
VGIEVLADAALLGPVARSVEKAARVVPQVGLSVLLFNTAKIELRIQIAVLLWVLRCWLIQPC